MVDTDLIKTLLDHETFVANRDRLTPGIFDEDHRDLYEILVEGHTKYEHDLSVSEMFALWKTMNPVATKSEKDDIAGLIEDVNDAEAMSEDVASDVINQLWRRDFGKRVAKFGLEMSEGNDEALTSLQTLMEKYSDGYMPDEFGEETSMDLDDLLEEVGDEHRFRFNIATLSRRVYGIGRSEFAVVFARPETGKTAFIVSICVGPEGFCEQGKKVLVLGNEEKTKRTAVRAYQAATGMTGEEIQADREKAKAIFRAKTQGRIVMKDIQDWDFQMVDAYIKKQQPDVVVIDQLDKVKVTGNYEKGHEKLREIYNQARECAKRHDCALIGVSQASAEGSGKSRLTFDMLEGSKTGKAAEADLIIGIGKHDSGDDDDPDTTRFLTVSKNKISGYHGTVLCTIEPGISRYVE